MVEKVALAPGVPGAWEETEGAPMSFSGIRLGTMVAILAIVAGALLLRLYHIDRWGLWVDEIYSVQHAIGLTEGRIDYRFLAWLPHLISFELLGVDVSNLASAEIWAWRAGGVTEWTMRAPVAVLGAISILVLALLSCRLLDTGPTLWLCLLLALSPWHLWMSQSCRFYIQLFLFYNIALLMYYRATEDGHLGRAGVAMVSLVVAFYTSPIALMILGVFAVDFVANLLRGRPTGMRPAFWVMGGAAIAVCAIGVVAKYNVRPEEYTAFRGTEQSIPVMTMGLVYMVGVPMAVTAALGLWSLVQRNERLAILLGVAVILPLAVFIFFNLLGKDTHVRYIFVSLFAWMALTAVGIETTIAALRAREGALIATLPGLALLSTFMLSDYIYMSGGAGYRGLWPQAAAYVEAHRRPGELVGGDWAGRRMMWYYLEDPNAIILPHGFTDEDMRELVPQPAWIVLRAHHPSAGDRTDELEAAGTLKATFANRVAQPYHAVNVYFYTPPAQSAATTAGSVDEGGDS